MRTSSQSRRIRRRCAVIIALPVVVALLAPAAAHGAAQADARVGLDTAGGAPVAGQVFLLTVLVESLPLSAGASFSFVTTLDLPAGVTFVAVGRSEPLPTVRGKRPNFDVSEPPPRRRHLVERQSPVSGCAAGVLRVQRLGRDRGRARHQPCEQHHGPHGHGRRRPGPADAVHRAQRGPEALGKRA